MRQQLYTLLIVLLFSAASSNYAAAQTASAETERQILALIKEKNSRTPVQQKIESSLLQAVRESRGQKMASDTYLDPANVKADATGNLVVDLRADVTDNLITAIENIGGTIVYSSWEFGALRVKINLNMVEAIAALPAVKFIEPEQGCMAVGSGLAKKRAIPFVVFPYPSSAESRQKERLRKFKENLQNFVNTSKAYFGFSGAVYNEGDRTHRADDVRNTYGYEGQGIKIGIMSDTYNKLAGNPAAADVAAGDLPGNTNPFGNTTPVTLVQDYTSGSDEGRAMTQIVHDIAPKAELFYATAFFSDAGFASNILALRNTYGCDIIIDDIFYYNESVFQDGVIAAAVNTVTAAGCLYFSSAGNEGNVAKSSAGYYEADFNDAGSLAFTFPGGTKAGTIHNFGTLATPINGDIILTAGSVYNLNWSDPATNATPPTNDYDLFVLNSAGTVKLQATTVQNGTAGQRPYEQITPGTVASGDRLVVFKTNAAAVRAFAINTIRGTLTLNTTGQIHGHNTAVDAYSVAATPVFVPNSGNAFGPYPGVFVGTNKIEPFSSDGPRRVFYTSAGVPISPGVFTFAAAGPGNVRSKPDITAADGVSTSLLNTSGLNPFYGTSAAAPHAGAIAALLKSAMPAITPAQMKTALISTAIDIETGGYDINSGFGIIQAFQAMQSIVPTPVSDIRLGTVSVTEAAPGANGSGSIDPAENANMVIQLTNPTLTGATTVNAVLSTATPGVTVTQANASYGTIASSGSGINTATPFKFFVDNTVACGTVIKFTITATYGGGGPTPQVFPIDFQVGFVPGKNITGTLGSAPSAGAGYTATSGVQTGRLNRFTPASVCGSNKANPGLQSAVGSRNYHAYTFTNTTAANQCVTVTYTSGNGSVMYVAAYNNLGFVPATPNLNYLADQGFSSTTNKFAFTAPAAQPFTIVVHEVNPASGSGFPYNLSVSLSSCMATIPVTWLGFTAQAKDKQVQLDWKITNEVDVTHYEVEHSTDARNFTRVADMPASAAPGADKSYQQMHAFPVTGNNYYRIKQIDRNGRYSYSTTELVRMNKGNMINISPNPANVFVSIKAAVSMKQIQLYNATGQLLQTEKPATLNYLLKTAHLPKGQYTLKIETEAGMINQKFIKE